MTPIRILAVDDDDLILKILGLALAAEGYEVITAADRSRACWKPRLGANCSKSQ